MFKGIPKGVIISAIVGIVILSIIGAWAYDEQKKIEGQIKTEKNRSVCL